MISRYDFDPSTTTPPCGYLLNHILLRVTPVPRGTGFPAIHDVADQIEILRSMVLKKIEQGRGLAAARTKVKVGEPDGTARLQGQLGRIAIRPIPRRPPELIFLVRPGSRHNVTALPPTDRFGRNTILSQGNLSMLILRKFDGTANLQRQIH